jgi:hypothetical protein
MVTVGPRSPLAHKKVMIVLPFLDGPTNTESKAPQNTSPKKSSGPTRPEALLTKLGI